MGIEYTIANHKNKTAFELGKGSWYALFEADSTGSVDFLYEESIYDIIVNEIWDYNIQYAKEHPEEDSSVNWLAYAKELAHKLFLFIEEADPSQLVLTNDSDDSTFELRKQGYRWIDSRYSDFDESFMNRHLISS